MDSLTICELDPAHTTIEFAVKHMLFTTVRAGSVVPPAVTMGAPHPAGGDRRCGCQGSAGTQCTQSGA